MSHDAFRNFSAVITLLFLSFIFSPQVQATAIKALGVKGSGDFFNAAPLLINGYMPAQGSTFDGPACVYWSDPEVSFVIDLGAVYHIDGITLQADNNDNYLLEASLDGQNFSPMLLLKSELGEIDWGMETVSTEKSNPQYLKGLGFTSAAARYLKVTPHEGDLLYSLSEIRVSGRRVIKAHNP